MHPAENFVMAFAKIESDIALPTLSHSSGLLYRNKPRGASVRPLKSWWRQKLGVALMPPFSRN
jgi:hypothetical protein